MKIAFLAYTYGTNGIEIPKGKEYCINFIDKDLIKEHIALAKEQNVDVICVSMHWGDEYVSLPSKEIKELSNWLIEQGVNHVIGNHPHVLQPIEIRESETTPDRHVVAYSIGNLISNMSLRRTDGGIMVGMELTRILNYTRVSVKIPSQRNL